jgi:hypothetical protein
MNGYYLVFSHYYMQHIKGWMDRRKRRILIISFLQEKAWEVGRQAGARGRLFIYSIESV